MSYTAIQTALDVQLASITGLPVLQRENTRYEPKTGTPWTRTTLSPAEVERLSHGVDLAQGLYLVDVFYPADRGSLDCSAMADTVREAFQRGHVLAGTGVTVHIKKSWREAGTPFQQFYGIQVVIAWSCELQRG